jgi:type I restriction enzyme S subunit
MESEWRKSKIGAEAQILLGFAFKSAEFAAGPPGHRLVRGDNVKRSSLEWGEATRFWRKWTPDLDKYVLREGDVVIGMDGSRVGENFARVSKRDLPALLVQRVACLRARATLDQQFLCYVICNPAFTAYIKAVHTGTSIPHISGRQIADYPLQVPPLPEQRAIAHILGTLDDKIDVNRRMSETLESMGRALFKSWFVDFDPVRAKANGRDTRLPAPVADLLPARLADSELGEIPEGWEILGLDKIARFVNGLALQNFPPGGAAWLPVIKIAQLRVGSSIGADRASASLESDYIVQDGDVLFSWSGSLECVLWAGGPGALNQHLFKVTSAKYPSWLCYFGVCEHLDDFRRIAAGKATTMGHIQRHHLSDAKLAIPPLPLMQEMDRVIGPMLERTWRLKVESRALADLRNALLPKLTSGEKRVGVAERFLERAK